MRGRTLLVASGALLVFLSFFLALHRCYQVDEAQDVTMARVIATHRTAEAFTNAPLYLLLIAPLANLSDRSSDLFDAFRVLIFALFWVNILLLTRATGARLRSREGAVTLAFVATLAPLWTYGLEFRHDNIQLFGLLLIWILARPSSGRPVFAAYFWMGLLAAFVQFSAFKAFVYWIPLSLAALALPHQAFQSSRARLLVEWVLGIVGGCGLYAFLRHLWGVTEPFAPSLSSSISMAARVVRMAPWPTLARFAIYAPLLTLAVLGALVLAIRAAVDRRWHNSATAEAIWSATFAAGAFASLFVNPNPFPYNLLLVAPPAAIAAAWAWRAPLLEIWDQHRLPTWFGLLLIAIQVVPFGLQLWRLGSWSNARQRELMEAAERLTDPAKDGVFDFAGLVPTRPSPGYFCFVNLTNASAFRGDRSLIENPAAVVIPNYRVGYLSKDQDTFLRQHYRAVAGDLLVLGDDIPPGTSTWICRHTGRYFLGSAAGPATFLVDGLPRGPGVYLFKQGEHHFNARAASMLFWVGPNLDAPPRVPEGQAAWVFPNPGAF